jgi:hypothetical protein
MGADPRRRLARLGREPRTKLPTADRQRHRLHVEVEVRLDQRRHGLVAGEKGLVTAAQDRVSEDQAGHAVRHTRDQPDGGPRSATPALQREPFEPVRVDDAFQVIGDRIEREAGRVPL